jgi:cytochrome c6
MKYSFLLAISAIAICALPSTPVKSSDLYNSSAGTAAELYAKRCGSCHGKDGQAKTFKGKFKHARNLADSEWQGNVSDERIFNSIMNGKGKMPPFEKKLSEQEIDSLVSYVRALKRQNR